CILGSGLISGKSFKRFPSATILALRGECTRNLLHAPGDIVLGDPGLLLVQMLQRMPPRKYLIGIVPHYKDKQNHIVERICVRYPSYVKYIDVQRHPVAVLHDIAQCEVILSSSLHGLVVADAI